MYDTYFITSSLPSTNWPAILTGIIATVISAIGIFSSYCLTSKGLKKTWDKNAAETQYRNSEFYLKKIESYFKEAAELITSNNNDNIKWHQSIDLLETSGRLAKNLTELSHQDIYVTEYKKVYSKVSSELKKIGPTSHQFFYGTENWRDLDRKQIIKIIKNFPSERISTSSLAYLSRFLSKLDKLSHKRQKDDSFSWENQFEELSTPILKGELSQEEKIGIMQNTACKVIINYIADIENSLRQHTQLDHQ